MNTSKIHQKHNHIGKFKHQINLSSEFSRSSKEDESAALHLSLAGLHRQACYFIIQAMEKSIRAKIFTLVNPNIDYFRNKNRHHSLEFAIEFLLEILSTDNIIKEQISNQLFSHVLGRTNYTHLHNNLRYPFYSEKFNSYSTLEVNEHDYAELKDRLTTLRVFLDELHKII